MLFVSSELERLSTLVGRPSESHPLHNSGLLSLDPVQDKTPLYSQLLQAYKWSNKVSNLRTECLLARSIISQCACLVRQTVFVPSIGFLFPNSACSSAWKPGRFSCCASTCLGFCVLSAC